MCEVDWVAWGTWAAVVVALGIAVADKISNFFQRRRETRILALLVMTELALLRVRLEELSAVINPEDGESVARDWYDASIAASPDERVELRQLGEKLDSPVLDSLIERLPHISAALGGRLAKVLSRLRLVRVGCYEPADTPVGSDFDTAQSHLALLRIAVKDSLESLASAVTEINSISRSR